MAAGLAVQLFFWGTLAAYAGLPRDVELSADEQLADEATGVTIARGNAVLTVRERQIAGQADVIELRPKLNEILFKGRAKLNVGHFLYESDTVSCTLDFIRCASVEDDQALPELSGSATINPR